LLITKKIKKKTKITLGMENKELTVVKMDNKLSAFAIMMNRKKPTTQKDKPSPNTSTISNNIDSENEIIVLDEDKGGEASKVPKSTAIVNPFFLLKQAPTTPKSSIKHSSSSQSISSLSSPKMRDKLYQQQLFGEHLVHIKQYTDEENSFIDQQLNNKHQNIKSKYFKVKLKKDDEIPIDKTKIINDITKENPKNPLCFKFKLSDKIKKTFINENKCVCSLKVNKENNLFKSFSI
jgi:hypothetical protein